MNAAMLGRLHIVKVLIELGADVQKKGQFGYTSLHAAAQGGHLEVVQALVKYGASVNCKNDDGDIPLILGMFEKIILMIFLIDMIFSIAVRGTHAEIIDYLLKAGSDIHQNGWLGQSAVHTASKFEKIRILRKLLFLLVANGDQATADTLLNREMMIGCSCSESHRHAREHLRQASGSLDD
jgi:ankyrin repeat protein